MTSYSLNRASTPYVHVSICSLRDGSKTLSHPGGVKICRVLINSKINYNYNCLYLVFVCSHDC